MIDDICETVREYVLDEKMSGNGTGEGTASEADRMADKIMSRLMTGAEDYKDIVFNCLLAASADTVILLNCGIPQVIKG